jgi:hypothetical protein
VILGGCLVIKGRGFGSQLVSSLSSVIWVRSSVSDSWVPHSLSTCMTLVSVSEGARFCVDSCS